MDTTFSDLGFGPNLLKAIDDVGYTSPTPIQEKAIPVALQGRDVLGCAQTGTGKTASFTLPMIEILSEGRAKARMPRSLILTPTRELAAQVADNFDLYGKYSNLSKALLIGGVDIVAQMKLVDTGVDVLIATPGRLLDVFERGGLMLTDIQVLVIDEADRMLDMGFIPDIERIVGLLPPLRQTLFFSATMAPEIKKIADTFLQNPKLITVAPPASAAETVDQHITLVGPRDKREALRQLIRTHDVSNAFVFCNRKRDVDIVANSLKKHGFNAGAIHGDMDQATRTETLAKFKDNALTILVASDVAARGIDIQGVSHVFNFDLPMNAEDYVHRIGRTGRAGRTGCAFSLATAHDAKLLAAIEKLINKDIPRHQVDGLSVDNSALEEAAAKKKGQGRPKKDAPAKKSPNIGAPKNEDRTQAGSRNAGRGRTRGGRHGRNRYEDDFDPNVPTEANQLPPFVTIGPNWLTELGQKLQPQAKSAHIAPAVAALAPEDSAPQANTGTDNTGTDNTPEIEVMALAAENTETAPSATGPSETEPVEVMPAHSAPEDAPGAAEVHGSMEEAPGHDQGQGAAAEVEPEPEPILQTPAQSETQAAPETDSPKI